MERLRQAIVDLIVVLDDLGPTAGAAEQITLAHLRPLARRVSRVRRPSDLYELMMHFKEFWATSIDWCSALSRQVERIIIIYEELMQASNDAAPEASEVER